MDNAPPCLPGRGFPLFPCHVERRMVKTVATNAGKNVPPLCLFLVWLRTLISRFLPWFLGSESANHKVYPPNFEDGCTGAVSIAYARKRWSNGTCPACCCCKRIPAAQPTRLWRSRGLAATRSNGNANNETEGCQKGVVRQG